MIKQHGEIGGTRSPSTSSAVYSSDQSLDWDDTNMDLNGSNWDFQKSFPQIDVNTDNSSTIYKGNEDGNLENSSNNPLITGNNPFSSVSSSSSDTHHGKLRVKKRKRIIRPYTIFKPPSATSTNVASMKDKFKDISQNTYT